MRETGQQRSRDRSGAHRQTITRRDVLRGGGTIGLVALAAACLPAGTGQPAAVRLRDDLRVALASMGNEALDPIAGPSNNIRYLDYLYDPLVGVNYQATEVSKQTGIAQDWTITDDGRTYTFQLRPWKFHNGDDVTADDVKFSLGRLAGPKVLTSYGSQIAALIESVAVKGPRTVELRIKRPSPLFLSSQLNSMADVSSYVVSKKYFETVGPDVFAQKPIGSGPYKFVERQVGAFFKFEQAYPEHYAIGKPRFKNITVRLVPEESTRVAMLKSGEADIIDVPMSQVESLKAAGFKLFTSKLSPILQINFAPFSPEVATSDVNVRKALSYAIDREQMNKTILGGLATVTGQVLPPQLGNVEVPLPPYDVAKAKQFLNQTEYREGGKKLTIQFQLPIRDGWPILALGEAVQSYWRRIGVDSVISYRDYGAIRSQQTTRSLPQPAAILLDLSGPPLDALSLARLKFTCKGLTSIACDPQLEALLEQWTAATDLQTYAARGVVTEKYILDQYLSLPIVYAPSFYMGNDQIRPDYTAGLSNTANNPRALEWGGS